MKEMEKLKEQVEEKIKTITEQGVQGSNLEVLGKLVDIHKDLKEVEHWENEDGGKAMYRGEYGNRGYGEGYSEGGYGARGNYREGEYEEGNYGRRGNYREGYSEGNYGRRMRDSRGRYKGQEMIDEMDRRYSNYSEGREQYGAEGKSLEELEYMMDAVYDFIKMLKQDVRSQKEMQIIDKGLKKLENV